MPFGEFSRMSFAPHSQFLTTEAAEMAMLKIRITWLASGSAGQVQSRGATGHGNIFFHPGAIFLGPGMPRTAADGVLCAVQAYEESG